MDKSNLLKNVFELSEEDVSRIDWEETLDCFEWQEVKKDIEIIKEGEQSDCFYVIVSGMVKIIFSDDIGTELISIIKDGELFGEMGFLLGNQRTASCITMKDSILIKLTNQNFIKIKERYPNIAIKIYEKIIKTLSLRLKRTTDRLYSRFL